jgi:hypothetical protein
MSRPLRLEFASALYHITSRGNARNLIYLQDDDFELFLQFLAIVCERYNWVEMLGSGLVFCISSFLDYGCLIHI